MKRVTAVGIAAALLAKRRLTPAAARPRRKSLTPETLRPNRSDEADKCPGARSPGRTACSKDSRNRARREPVLLWIFIDRRPTTPAAECSPAPP